ncbi:MAG: family 1 glycosylhydrolase [Tomitella sp.]|nr:family 1 glycosylhydrolase [Tomitella sp.]
MGRRLARAVWAVSAVALGAGLLAVPQLPAEADGTGPPPVGDDFHWGVAMSEFQSGGYFPDSNWTRYAEQSADPYENSVDFYHRYPEDIQRAADLGVDTFRLSIEWARLEPQPGQWDEAAFEYYDDVLDHIVDAGMRPMITLDHWVYPGWVADQGGWANQKTVDDWLANARKVVDRYAHLDPMWVTFNEGTAYMMQEVKNGGLAPQDIPAMFDRLAQSHNAIYDHIHAVQPGAMVTTNASYIPTVEPVMDAQLIDKVADRLDFIGVDYYYGVSPANPTAIYALLDEHWKAQLEPEGIYYALRYYARKFPGKPLYIVENGMPTDNGAPRADGQTRSQALRDDIYWLQRAKADGMNVIGYNYWSLADNYEWGTYTPRFGLYTVDVLTDPTLTRHPTDAVPTYRDITRTGGVPDGYVPSHAPAPCSLVDAPSSCLDPVTVPGG